MLRQKVIWVWEMRSWVLGQEEIISLVQNYIDADSATFFCQNMNETIELTHVTHTLTIFYMVLPTGLRSEITVSLGILISNHVLSHTRSTGSTSDIPVIHSSNETQTDGNPTRGTYMLSWPCYKEHDMKNFLSPIQTTPI